MCTRSGDGERSGADLHGSEQFLDVPDAHPRASGSVCLSPLNMRRSMSCSSRTSRSRTAPQEAAQARQTPHREYDKQRRNLRGVRSQCMTPRGSLRRSARTTRRRDHRPPAAQSAPQPSVSCRGAPRRRLPAHERSHGASAVAATAESSAPRPPGHQSLARARDAAPATSPRAPLIHVSTLLASTRQPSAVRSRIDRSTE
jgi:hypothetical protein